MTGLMGYFVLGAPRSGSNLLCDALRATGLAGHPDEWYGPSGLHDRLQEWGLAQPDSRRDAPRATDWQAYRQRLLADTATGNRFGLKIFRYQAEFLFRGGQLSSPEDLMPEDCRDDLRAVVLRRRDVVAQAVSVAIAARTGVYASVSGEVPARVPTTVAFWTEGPPPPLVPVGQQLTLDMFPAQEIHSIVSDLRRQYTAWDDWLTRTAIPRLVVCYEDLVVQREQTLSEIFQFLGIQDDPADYTETRFRRQTTSLNEEIMEAYNSWPGIQRDAAAILPRGPAAIAHPDLEDHPPLASG